MRIRACARFGAVFITLACFKITEGGESTKSDLSPEVRLAIDQYILDFERERN